MRQGLQTAVMFLMGATLSPAAHLSRPAESAFEGYITNLEARLARQHSSPDRCVATLAQEGGAVRTDAERELLAGAVRVEPVNGGSWEVNGALLHHWRAAAFVPGVSPKDLLKLLGDYDNLARYFAPEVVSSRSVAGDGVMAMRFKKRLMITVVLDAEFDTESGLAGGCGYRFSRSTHIWQIDGPGSEHERRRAEGSDDGFLWRLNSYWSFEKWRDGLLMECEAVSLTRDVPAGLGWLVTPLLESLPRASLEFTLAAARNALSENATKRNLDARSN